MSMDKLSELYAIIPVAMLLTVSFFVLLAARKLDSKALKIFGQTVAVILWVAAGLVLFAGISLSSCKKHKMPMRPGMMHEGGMMSPEVMPHEPPPMQR